MDNLWSDEEAAQYIDDPLGLRAYTSRLIGQNEDLVLHGGGNTSVKMSTQDFFGDVQDILYVKGSGWDLGDIEPAGFSPVRLDTLRRMALFEKITDNDMVTQLRAAMLNPDAPGPSVEAILHAIIPYQYVDHTHADAVVSITNTSNGESRIREIYGDRVLIIPYVMPGFVLSRKVMELAKDIDWSRLEGMVLMNHGIFSFADDAKTSYERMLKLVNEADEYLVNHDAKRIATTTNIPPVDLSNLSYLRKTVSGLAGKAQLCQLNNSPEAVAFSMLESIDDIATRGPLTPDHVIRTKRIPLIVGEDIDQSVNAYRVDYEAYFNDYTDGKLICLDVAPRWAVWPGQGVVAFGSNIKEVSIVSDIVRHTISCIQWAESLGGWQALPAKDIFEVEYWELEQAKLKKTGAVLPFQGKVALVTGAASGIGKASVESLLDRGAAVIALDINPAISTLFDRKDVLALTCDICDVDAVIQCIDKGVSHFGGLDIIISNAGIFPASESIADMKMETWKSSIDINLTSHQQLLTRSIPYLKQGIDSAVIIIGSKNVPAPGPGASAYSAAKAGLNQLVRIAAMELASDGIRVNTVHPNAVFDTAIWTDEVLSKRAAHYGLTVEEYKTNNMLKVEVTSRDVAEMVCEMAGSLFAKTTGAQVPIDGGNERVI